MHRSIGLRLASVFAAAVMFALALAGAAGAASLYGGRGQRPGPEILYRPPATSPALTNSGVWHAAPILISGTSVYRQGEFLYQDWLYDDHGAHGAYRDQNDPQKAPGGMSTSSDIFSAPNGTYTYPTAAPYVSNAADFVELRARPVSGATAFRITLNSLTDPALIGISLALGGTPGVNVPFPHGANVVAPADRFVTIHGHSAEVTNAAGVPIDASVPVSIDLARRQIEVRIPVADWDPTGRIERLAAGIGLWDMANNRYLLPQDNADATHPGGAGGSAAPAAFFNVAFRFEHSSDASSQTATNQEPRPSPSDVQGVVANAAWWRDRAQGGALLTGNISGMFVNVDFRRLAAGATDDMTDRSQGVPSTGAMDRILSSHFETAQGRDYSTGCASAQSCKGELRGQLQPYAIYIPAKAPPAGGYGLTLLLHSLSANYNQYFATRNQSQFGDRASGSIVVTPEGRGPDGWYYDYAGADTFEVWADVASRYRLDPSYGVATGYSMGGYGTYKLATQFPDLFARGQPTVGPPGLGIWVPPSAPTGGQSTNTYDQLGSLRNVPFLIWNASSDELVPVAGPVTQAQRFSSLGLRYEFDLFSPAEHLTLAFNDQFQPAADFLGNARIDFNPAHVTYVYNPSMDFPADGTSAGHAYWVSGVTLRDPNANTGRGSIDVRSEAFGVGDPVPSGSSPGQGQLTGGNVPSIGYSSQTQTWGAAPRTPAANRLDITAVNVSRVTIDAARARVSCNAVLNVTSSDGPLTTNLVDCPGATRPGIHFPRRLSCSSKRTLTVHFGRPRGSRVLSIALSINGHRRRLLRGANLRSTRVDLRGLPRGRFTVRFVVRLIRNGHLRTLRSQRTYRTCAPAAIRHRRRAGQRVHRLHRRDR